MAFRVLAVSDDQGIREIDVVAWLAVPKGETGRNFEFDVPDERGFGVIQIVRLSHAAEVQAGQFDKARSTFVRGRHGQRQAKLEISKSLRKLQIDESEVIGRRTRYETRRVSSVVRERCLLRSDSSRSGLRVHHGGACRVLGRSVPAWLAPEEIGHDAKPRASPTRRRCSGEASGACAQVASLLQLVIRDHDAVPQQRIERFRSSVVFRLIPEVECRLRAPLRKGQLGTGGQAEAVARGARGQGAVPGGLRQLRVRRRGDQTNERVTIPRGIPIFTPQIRQVGPPMNRKGKTKVGRDLELTEPVLPCRVDSSPDRSLARLAVATPQFFAINRCDHVVHGDTLRLERTRCEHAADLQSVIGKLGRGLFQCLRQAAHDRRGEALIIRVRQQLPELRLAGRGTPLERVVAGIGRAAHQGDQ